jgi:peptidoglycan hydrolase CwlO-like protein
MPRKPIDYKKICSQLEVEKRDAQNELFLMIDKLTKTQKSLEEITEDRESWMTQSTKYEGAIEYLEKHIFALEDKLKGKNERT